MLTASNNRRILVDQLLKQPIFNIIFSKIRSEIGFLFQIHNLQILYYQFLHLIDISIKKDIMDSRYNINRRLSNEGRSFRTRSYSRKGRVGRKHYEMQRKQYDVSQIHSLNPTPSIEYFDSNQTTLQSNRQQNLSPLITVVTGILPKNIHHNLSLLEIQKECDALTPETNEDDFEEYRQRAGFSNRFIDFEDQWQQIVDQQWVQEHVEPSDIMEDEVGL